MQSQKQSNPVHCRRQTRHGVLVVEMMVCTVLLAMVTLILVPGLQAVGKQRQAIRFETLAMIELNNRHQELLHRGPEPLDIDNLPLSRWFQRRYPSASLQAEVLPVTETESAAEPSTESDLSLTAIRLTVRRSAGTGRPDGNASVVVWLPDLAGSEMRKDTIDGGTSR